MSVITPLIEGLALVMLLFSLYLHFKVNRTVDKYKIAATNLDNMIELYRPSMEKWKVILELGEVIKEMNKRIDENMASKDYFRLSL